MKNIVTTVDRLRPNDLWMEDGVNIIESVVPAEKHYTTVSYTHISSKGEIALRQIKVLSHERFVCFRAA